jgi:hypothetical protein
LDLYEFGVGKWEKAANYTQKKHDEQTDPHIYRHF